MSVLRVPLTGRDHVRGSVDAPITLIEYGDFECPVCCRAFPEIQQLLKNFGTKIKFVYRHFPLIGIHPLAEIAAEISEFAADQGKFWEIHDLIYTNQATLDLSLLYEMGENLILPKEDLLSNLNNGIYKSKVKNDFLGGVYSGVSGTPTLFINGERHKDVCKFEVLAQRIEKQLITS